MIRLQLIPAVLAAAAAVAGAAPASAQTVIGPATLSWDDAVRRPLKRARRSASPTVARAVRG